MLVITHDDGYFSCADRIIKLDYGQLVLEKRVGDVPAEPVRAPADDDLVPQTVIA